MIYWSIYPLEVVLDGYDDPRRQPQLVEMQVQGRTMVVEHVGPAQVRIHRLVSPRPSDYLNPRLAPGELLSLSSLHGIDGLI
ncbi:MAG: YlzJ-like family protein [Firmicutes bacterium]|nr:YlzJ-like family protein [Bacillota bacterium]